MPSYSKNDIILVRYPFSNLTNFKVRPAVVVNSPHNSKDLLIVPLTSKTDKLLAGEFVLADWENSGLNVETAVKRGVYAIHESLVLKQIGKCSETDSLKLENSLRKWLGI